MTWRGAAKFPGFCSRGEPARAPANYLLALGALSYPPLPMGAPSYPPPPPPPGAPAPSGFGVNVANRDSIALPFGSKTLSTQPYCL